LAINIVDYISKHCRILLSENTLLIIYILLAIKRDSYDVKCFTKLWANHSIW